MQEELTIWWIKYSPQHKLASAPPAVSPGIPPPAFAKASKPVTMTLARAAQTCSFSLVSTVAMPG